jgi:hypothetical protein
LAQDATVLLNGFQMNLRKAVPQVYQFELNFIAEKAPKKGAKAGDKGEQVPLERGPRNE